MKTTRAISFAAGTAAFTCLLVGTAQAATIVNDSFADGDRAATGPLQADFFASSNSNAIESNAGSIGLVSGSSGRQIHGLFPTQTLAAAGDTLTTSFTFVTPDTVAAGNEDIRFGIFDHLGRNTPTQLAQDTTYSSGSPNPDYSGLPGYYSELDVESADSGTDLNIRSSDPTTSGRLLATSSGFTSEGSSSDIGYAIVANTEYTATMSATRGPAGELDITTTFLGNSFTITDPAPLSYDFGMLAYGSSSGAFGSSNTPGDPDNGIDITNVTVEFIPEPTSALSLGMALLLGSIARRR
ncbi:MAG: hypothetical protein AAF266_02365 [Planctomycetota bacterium]